MTERRGNDRRADKQDRLLTDGQVAGMAGVSASTVRYWRLMGKLPFVKVGKHTRVWLSEFQKVFRKPPQVGSIENSGDPVKYLPLRTLGGQHG
jgi:hypothetical protein